MALLWYLFIISMALLGSLIDGCVFVLWIAIWICLPSKFAILILVHQKCEDLRCVLQK